MIMYNIYVLLPRNNRALVNDNTQNINGNGDDFI